MVYNGRDIQEEVCPVNVRWALARNSPYLGLRGSSPARLPACWPNQNTSAGPEKVPP